MTMENEEKNEEMYEEKSEEELDEKPEDKHIEKLEEKNQDKLEEVLEEESEDKNEGKKFKSKRVFIISGAVLLSLLLIIAWLGLTRSGRRVIYKIAGGVIYDKLDTDDETDETPVINPIDKAIDNKGKENSKKKDSEEETVRDDTDTPRIKPEPRKEDYVSNFLIFGLEEIEHAKNADAIMIASINTKDNTVKLTSILRDTYIDMEGYNPNKINAFFSLGGAKTLVNVIEDKYRIKIDGYAYLNFESFENIIDYLGGIDIELGEAEAKYLNRTNYISIKANRNVKPGWNLLNGNQALGYCRVRLVETLGGANDDYGRTLRQRRVLKAIFNKYKSKGLFDLIKISGNILGHVKTNFTRQQIEKSIEDIIENKITTMDTMRIPVNGAFEDPKEYGGITYPLVYDWDENIIQLYQFIFLDSRQEAESNLEKYR